MAQPPRRSSAGVISSGLAQCALYFAFWASHLWNVRGSVHIWYCFGRCSFMCHMALHVCIHLNVPSKAADLFPAADCFAHFSDPSIGEEFWSLSRAIPMSGSPTSCILDLRVTALLLRLCAISESEIRISDPQKVFVQNARQFMQEHFGSIHCVAEVARHVGVSEDYLRHLFQRLEGISMTQYLARLRLDRAKDLLRHSRLPLKSIASQCGFQTDRYFCTRFLAYTGLSPLAFRKQPGGPRPPDL